MARIILDKKDSFGVTALGMSLTPVSDEEPTEVVFTSYGNYSSSVRFITVDRSGFANVGWGENTLYTYEGVDFNEVVDIVLETHSLGKAGNFIKYNSTPKSKMVFGENEHLFSTFNEETQAYEDERVC
tara:strand:- start:2094 stop:2477 length:384 start_codon:yes stop_codon:yes gene_type:complete